MNMDAAYDQASRRARMRIVIRDTRGKVKLGAMTRIVNGKCPMHAEMNAVLFGVGIVRGRGFEEVEVESDSALVVQEINKAGVSFWEWAALTREVVSLAAKFKTCRFSNVRRFANSLAHSITGVECPEGEIIVSEHLLSFIDNVDAVLD
ncbi:uncharacterized protein LOC111302346 [Durio zibethinus]|uniref:Uncharacterized protein LOC111302346 n=1 Tax=Durio zibethinus TaxID=66656 RepID=A0A6P5ZN98_DURZI|nr:uncharacterized protein LOC111302346 [Durio zibethinus]